MKKFAHLKKVSTLASYALVAAVVLVGVSFVYQKKVGNIKDASSATYYDFHGQAWSDNIGWISFNCAEGGPTNNNICGTSNYKVQTDATGVLSGAAWSDNVGWISFQQTSGCPTAPCQPTLTAGGLTGWARVMSAIQPVDPNPDRGGWDGWIDLSQSSRSANDMTGEAWGDINLGWLSFNCADGGPTNNNICGTSNYKVYLTPIVIPDPTLTFNAPVHAYVGSSTTLTWSTTDINTCTASGSWSGSKAVPGGSEGVGPFGAQGAYTYNLNCLNTVYNIPIGGTRIIDVTDGLCGGGETTTGNPFDCTSVISRFESNPKIVKEKGSSRLEWTIQGGQSCRLYSPSNVLLQTIPDGNQTGTYNLTNITQKATYRISCSGNVNVYTTVSVYLLYEY